MGTSAAESAYVSAQRQARAAAGTLSVRLARNIEYAFQQYADQVARLARSLPPGASRAALDAARKLILAEANGLHRAIVLAVQQHRALTAEDVQRVWQQALSEVAGLQGIPLATFGAVPLANLPLTAAYERLGGAANTWVTLLGDATKAMAREVDGIVRAALTSGMGPDELARKLRPYVAGSEDFRAAFGSRSEANAALYDFRRASPELADAVRTVRSNANRIAFSELHNAKQEAEVTAFAADPSVEAVIWELADDRGKYGGADECDVYAQSDLYGLGEGVYPVDAVPLPPHPYCRCEVFPLLRDPVKWTEDKPTAESTGGADNVTIKDVAAIDDGLTRDQARAIAERVREQTSAIEATSHRMTDLIDSGIQAASEALAGG